MDPALEAEIRAAHGAILDRFEQGLSEIEESARALMRSAAEDTVQGTGEELKELREQIVRDLSRHDTVRGLVAHADERFQSVDIRVARIEGNLADGADPGPRGGGRGRRGRRADVHGRGRPHGCARVVARRHRPLDEDPP
jgi:hypothetical protein